MIRRALGFFLCLCMGVTIWGTRVDAGFDLSQSLPSGAVILEALAHTDFDRDDSNELLVLADCRGSWSVYLMNSSSRGFQTMFQVEIGPAGYLRKERIGDTFSPLGIQDINGDGILDFWVVSASSVRSRGEIAVYISSGGTYRSVAEINADYDLQFANYQGEWVIHSVDRELQTDTLRIRSFVWEKERERFVMEDEEYRIATADYRRFARNRLRPQLFAGKKPGEKHKDRWCRSLLTFKEIPQGAEALSALLPKKAYLLDFLPEQDLDNDVDDEYLLAYLLTDSEDSRRVHLYAAIADWSPEDRCYTLKPLEGAFYGLARSAEGNFYQPIYLLKGNGLSHPVIVGNAEPDKPMIQMNIFASTGLHHSLVDVFQANYSIQLKERTVRDGFHYQAIGANLGKDGRVTVSVERSEPNNDVGACEPFVSENNKVMTIREFRRAYPFFEGTDWIVGGYETSILRTNHEHIPAFEGPLPESQKFRMLPEEYLGRNFTALGVRDYWPEDFNGDGAQEVLVLVKTDEAGWPPSYRLGYLRPTGAELEIVPLGPPYQPGDDQPANGVYLADINGDRVKEILGIRRGTNPETLRQGVNLEILGFRNNQWVRLHAREIWYDDLRLSWDASGLRLFGFLAQGLRKTQGTVYEFAWQNDGFRLEKKHPVNGFAPFLRLINQEKTDFFTDYANLIRLG